MTSALWTNVDEYFSGLAPDPAPAAVLAASEKAGLPAIAVSEQQGRFLEIFARAMGARRILEVGTLGGFSALFLARALPSDGQLITLEYLPHHAKVARENLTNAGLAGKVEVRVGAALDLLPALEAEKTGPFDLIFLDAEKSEYPDYFRHALNLVRPGGVIIADNVVRGGDVLDENSDDPKVQGVRALAAAVAAEERVSAAALQTVGSKGYDGFMIIYVKS